MASPKTLRGSYTRKDDGASFAYSVAIARAERGTVWSARVVSNGEVRGRPSGLLQDRQLHEAALEAAVRELVEASIRDRASVT